MIQLAILGCGAIAGTHAKALAGERARVRLWFASRSLDCAKAFAARHGGAGAFGSYQAACAARSVDAVLICTPHDQHFGQAVMALEAGKHVVVEKPMAVTLDQAVEMNRRARAANRLLLVAENHRFRPSVRVIERHLAAGDLGQLKWVRMHLLSKRRLRPDEWRADAGAMGGGAFIDGGIHWVNQLLTYLGGAALKVFAQQPILSDPGFPCEDTLVTTCTTASGAAGSLSYSWGIAGSPRNKLFSLHGSEGSLYCLVNGLAGWVWGKRRSPFFLPFADARGFVPMWRDFLDTLAGQKASLMTGVEGARDLAFVLAAYRSARSGEAVELAPMSSLRG